MSAGTSQSREQQRKSRPKRKRQPWTEAMGVTEVAEALGVTTSNLDRVARLPKHRQVIASGRLWSAAEVRAFAKARRRRKQSGQDSTG